VVSAGPYASLHLAPDRQSHQLPTTQFFTGRMPFLPPNQQRQSTEGTHACRYQTRITCVLCHWPGSLQLTTVRKDGSPYSITERRFSTEMGNKRLDGRTRPIALPCALMRSINAVDKNVTNTKQGSQRPQTPPPVSPPGLLL